MKVKRASGPAQRPLKRRKLNTQTQKISNKGKGKTKENSHDKAFIPIPNVSDESGDEAELSEQDLDFFDQNAEYGGFLQNLDRKAISRSKKETARLHKLVKPERIAREDDLPSIGSHDEDEGLWDSVMGDSEDHTLNSEGEDSDETGSDEDQPDHDSSDTEKSYEMVPRKSLKSTDDKQNKGIRRLPIKLPDGRVKFSDTKIIPRNLEESSEEEYEEDKGEEAQEIPSKVEDVSTGARFGRPAVRDVIGQKSRRSRIQAAKEQIASICRDIIADPENGIGLLKRLHTFSLAEIKTPSLPEPTKNDIAIRKLSILSQSLVFKDIIPGYRIRELTEKEKADKVSQAVQRTRDFEQGLVSAYLAYLRALDEELKLKSELSDIALKCICQLLVELTHFNFRSNLIAAVVSRLCRKSWSDPSELCMQSIISVFRADKTGQVSLEVVRALNRIIKDRKFNVHPDVLSCLLHLRLKTELGGVRASNNKAEREKEPGEHSKGRAAARRSKGKPTTQPHLSKRAQKKLKETKAIEVEMKEADAEVDREERAHVHTETLKLIFVLYFSILKDPQHSRLLLPALRGISRFAHLVNIDFFKDLMQVLKSLMKDSSSQTIPTPNEDPGVVDDDTSVDSTSLQLQLQCIITAFELLSGQGEALNIDLYDFVLHLYSLILPASLSPEIESLQSTSKFRTSPGATRDTSQMTIAEMLFRALELVFSPTSKGSSSFKISSTRRTAAFVKRLSIACLQFPASSTLRALAFIRQLIERDQALTTLLPVSHDDDGGGAGDGIYRADIDDPELCNALASSLWELCILSDTHVDSRVRKSAETLVNFVPTS